MGLPQLKRDVTRMGKITTVLAADANGLAQAASLLNDGELVAFPTETVYGLGADARNGRAVAGIFEAKGRPSFNPLIVHVARLADVEEIGQVPGALAPFVAAGWPDGLTLVLPLKAEAGISPLVTAGQSTVAVRVPASHTARDLLDAFGGPIAAPSANPSGRISPTQAAHVLGGLDGRIAAVLDGGATPGGVESTILGVFEDAPVVLREGLYQVPEHMARHTQADEVTEVAAAPGQLTSHYAPRGRVRLGAERAEKGEWFLGFGGTSGDRNLSESGDLAEAAARLFALFHEADALGVTAIAVAPIPNTGLGRAINDRLRRAAAPRDATHSGLRV